MRLRVRIRDEDEGTMDGDRSTKDGTERSAGLHGWMDG